MRCAGWAKCSASSATCLSALESAAVCRHRQRRVAKASSAFLTWNFEFRLKRFRPPRRCKRYAVRRILKLTADGLIEFHRDYWDAAEELYEKLPLLGGLMRWLKRRANQ